MLELAEFGPVADGGVRVHLDELSEVVANFLEEVCVVCGCIHGDLELQGALRWGWNGGS